MVSDPTVFMMEESLDVALTAVWAKKRTTIAKMLPFPGK